MDRLGNHRYWKLKDCVEAYQHFDESRTDYSSNELETFADAIIFADAERGENIERGILSPFTYYSRRKREIYNTVGTADPTLTNTTSPDGQRMFHRIASDGDGVKDDYFHSKVLTLHQLGHNPNDFEGRDKRIRFDFGAGRWRVGIDKRVNGRKVRIEGPYCDTYEEGLVALQELLTKNGLVANTNT